MTTETSPAAANGIKVRGADFIQYWVTDMERSLRFYRDFLGMNVGETWDNWWVEVEAPPTTIALVTTRLRGSTEGVTIGGRAPTLYLAVEDVVDAVEKARAAGYTVTLEPDDGDVCILALILDPDGNTIGLHTRHNGTWG
jgi:catechol 2,3-dioxygenase-like lactoylglutathione lyase family enzyme